MQKISMERNAAVVKRKTFALSLPKSVRRRYMLFVILVAPAFLLRFTTSAYPILQTILLSFTNLNAIKRTNDYVGLQNYVDMTKDFGVRGALSFTIIYVLASTALELAVGMRLGRRQQDAEIRLRVLEIEVLAGVAAGDHLPGRRP